MLISTVVCLLSIVNVVRGTVEGAAFRPVYSDENNVEEDEEDRKVSACFGKVRLSCNLNPEFSAAVDKFARILRVDKLRELIEWKVLAICNTEEREVTLPMMREELSHSAAIIKEMVHNLSDFDRDRLNMWSNLNDTLSERNFFIERIKGLPPNYVENLTKSLDSLVSRLVNGEPPSCISDLIGAITPDEKQSLSNHTPSFEQVIKRLLERIGTPNSNEDLRQFLSGTWKLPDQSQVMSER